MAGQYQDRQDSSIYGARLIIHRRVDLDNDNFYFRAKVAGHNGYIRRSCQTPDPARAMLLAEQAYEELLVRAKGGFALKTVSVDGFFEGLIEATKHRLTETRYKWKKSVYARYVSGHLGKKNISDLTKKDADGYWHYRLNFWNSDAGQERIANNKERAGAKTFSSHNVAKMPSFATLKAEASLINEMLRAAVDEGHLQRSIKISPQDAIAKSERTDGYRDTFTDDEWRILTVHLYNYAHRRGQYAGKRVNVYHQLQRRMLHLFVLLASSTDMRVGELRQLRWKDLEARIMDDGQRRLVVSVRGETSKVRRGRTAVAQSDHIIGVLDEFQKISGRIASNDLIFYSERDGEVGEVDLSTAFKTFLKNIDHEGRAEGLRTSSDDKARTLYSLRHFYAIQRLKQGVDICRLAENMGTGADS
jgi:integrase